MLIISQEPFNVLWAFPLTIWLRNLHRIKVTIFKKEDQKEQYFKSNVFTKGAKW